MLMNAFTFRRKNFEIHYLNKIMIIFMQNFLNIKFFKYKIFFKLIRRKY